MIGNREPATGNANTELDRMRLIARRNFAIGRRWFLRAMVLFGITLIALGRGGQIMYIIGGVAMVLGFLSISLGRAMRKNAKASLEKIALMEKTATGNRQPAAGGAP